MASFYQLDDEIRDLLTLENFLGDLTVPDFIDKISQRTAQTTRSDENSGIKYDDPRPYIRSFELVSKELNNLSIDCESKKSKLDQLAANLQVKHDTNVKSLNGRARVLTHKLDHLSGNVDKVHNNSINPLGERLKKTNNIKENAANLIRLTKCYNEFYTNGVAPTELIQFSNGDMGKVAKTWNQLLQLSSKLSVDPSLTNAKTCHEVIVEESDKFEANILKAFSKFYALPDPNKCQELTKILFEYNDGVKLVASYASDHPLARDLDPLDPITDSFWVPLGNPDKKSFQLDDMTRHLLDSVLEEMKSNLTLIQRIFQDKSCHIPNWPT
ncbi:unnamed protein product [Ambrosiozyma monospora]|uniref:Unnamed protein product n=1 Tax=Ambrosiozyma monospora TaxID=43982 RepID=A0ACB5T604_AMBMO|nr:unnamed protein product [Ambrosiozyma monospora]